MTKSTSPVKREGPGRYVTEDGRRLTYEQALFRCDGPHPVNRGGRWFECGGGVKHYQRCWVITDTDGTTLGAKRTLSDAIRAVEADDTENARADEPKTPPLRVMAEQLALFAKPTCRR
jgi:hypothetical protein